jgi:alkylation response protein AidB-like acyl-CoA dehydrogenase
MPGLDVDTLQMTLESVKEFAATSLPDQKMLELDANEEFPIEIVRQLCGEGLGIQLLFVPEEYGGMGGGAFDVYRLCERMAAIDLGVATGVLATFLGSEPISVGGTPEQRKYWMTRLADEGLLMAYAATEPEAGSDLGALRTTATPIEEGGRTTGYRIRGNKQWISNGGFADLYVVLAQAPGGPSWFIVDRGAPGLSSGKPEDKHGIRDSNTASVSFEDVVVDADRLLGETEGQGLRQAQAVFGYTRLMVAAFGIGCGWEAMERAMAYSTQRVQAGSPLSEKQGYTHKLIVPHVARLEAARAYVEESAERIDAGEGSLNAEGAIAKYLGSEAGNAAAEAAIQALGGYGYTREYMVEKIKRDVRITTIYEGTSEIMEMTIARERWRKHLKSRGEYYREEAARLKRLHREHDDVGAQTAALALNALVEVLDRCRQGRLTRQQHVLLRLGELITYAECAASFARRAARALDGALHDKADTRFTPAGLAAVSRVFARTASSKVAEEGLGLIVGAGGVTESELPEFEQALGVSSVHAGQIGMLCDMNSVADALYGREG